MTAQRASQRRSPDRSVTEPPLLRRERTASPAYGSEANTPLNTPDWTFAMIPVHSSPPAIQRKLTIGAVDDPLEREAEAVAECVMRMPESPMSHRNPRDGGVVQRKCAGCEGQDEEERKLNRKQSPNGIPSTPHIAPPVVHSVLHQPGERLDAPTRTFFEPRLGFNLSEVRIHRDSAATESARAVGALAYTVGNDIVFARGAYRPDSSSGKQLLAHELAHVAQQSGVGATVGQADEKRWLSPTMRAETFSRHTASSVDLTNNSCHLNASSSKSAVLSRFPSPVSFGIYTPGLSFMPPVIKEGYDGSTYTAIKTNWGLSSWERRWQIYDAEDKLLYELYYTWPQPTLYIPEDAVAKGKAGGSITPWSVWHEVTETGVPFGGSDEDNFPYTYMKFYVYDTWKDFMADPNAKLSDIKQDRMPGQEPGKPTPLDSSIVKGAESVMDYGSVVAMHEAYLRKIYDNSAKGITESAKELVSKGLPQGDAAKWANEARNVLKDKIRTDGNPILKKVFESRNLNKYGNKLGPSYEQLFQKYSKQGLLPEEINKKIIEGSGKANIKLNRWTGRLKVAGRFMLFIDIALAGVRVYLAPEGEKTKVALEEVARIGGALVMGAAGAKGGAAVGAAVGAFFFGAGAVPGAIIGGVIGMIGGAIFGGWLGKSAVEKLYEMFPPSDCVFEGDFKEEDQ